jgi:hypothetical protein
MSALSQAVVGRPDLALLGLGLGGGMIALIGIVLFRYIYFGRSK